MRFIIWITIKKFFIYFHLHSKANGDCETSYFTSNPVTGPAIPPICGGNDGLHIYMDAGAYYDDQSTFSVVVGESGLDWKILVGFQFFVLVVSLINLQSLKKTCTSQVN